MRGVEERALRWRCRRGARELDLMLARYLERRYPQAPAPERRAFARLLDLPDPELQALLFGPGPGADAALRDVAGRVRAPERAQP